MLIAKPGTDGVLLEVWGGGRLLKELQVWTDRTCCIRQHLFVWDGDVCWSQ